jgi:hypothetical protein
MSSGASANGQAPVFGPTMKSNLFSRIQGDRRDVNALDRHVRQVLAPVIQRHDRRASRALSRPLGRHQWHDRAAFLATACLMHEGSLLYTSHKFLLDQLFMLNKLDGRRSLVGTINQALRLSSSCLIRDVYNDECMRVIIMSLGADVREQDRRDQPVCKRERAGPCAARTSELKGIQEGISP